MFPDFKDLNWIRRIVLLGEYALKYCEVPFCFPNLYISYYLFQQKQPLISHDFLNQSSFMFLFKILSFPSQLYSEPINIKRYAIRSRKLKPCWGLSGSLWLLFPHQLLSNPNFYKGEKHRGRHDGKMKDRQILNVIMMPGGNVF